MELKKFEQQIKSKLPRPKGTNVVDEKQFCFPVHTVQVKYYPISRTPMDILMKMMLIAFNKGSFHDGETLADVLLVDPLFINDLLNKMIKTGLLVKEEVISLTEKGKRQLAEGIFEEELEEVTQELLYSPLHGAYLTGDIDEILEFDEFPDELSYAQQFSVQFDEQQTIEALESSNNEEEDEDALKTFISSINEIEELQINDVPCFQYILYHTEQDVFDVKVFNTLTNAWDEQLEQLLKDNELSTWRDRYK